MIRFSALGFATAIQLATVLTAQSYIVDARNGPGTHYTSIREAVAAVPSGADLVVRAGTYDPFRIDAKSVTVRGESGATVASQFGSSGPGIEIINLARTQSVTLTGLSWSFVFGGRLLAARDSLGAIVIDDCDTGAASGAFEFTLCEHVMVRNSELQDPSIIGEALRTFRSNVTLESCDLASGLFCIRQGGGRIHLSNCRLHRSGAAFAGTAVFMAGGDLVANADTVIENLDPLPSLGIDGNGTVAFDPSTVFRGTGPTPIGSGITATARIVPRLHAETSQLGGIAHATLHTDPTAMVALLVGFPSPPTSIPGLPDPVWLTDAVVQAFVPSGAQAIATSYPVPNAPWLRGVQITWQGVEYAPSTADFRASNPSGYTHH